MKQFWTIFKFEFKNYAKNKAFIIVTLLVILVVGVVLSIPRIQQAMGSDEQKGQEPQTKSVVALVDKTGGDVNAAVAFFAASIKDTDFKATTKSIEELKADVDNGTYNCAVVLNTPLAYTYVVKNIGMYDDFSMQLDSVLLAKYRSDSLTKMGVSAADANSFLTAQVKSDKVQTSSGKDQMKNFFYTYILIFALYMAILLYGQFVATSVATEKSTRAMELLITSTDPKNLMFGKVLGAGLAGMTQFTLILGSSYAFYNLNKSYFEKNQEVNQIIQSIFNMPLSILLYTILFFVLGFFIYAFLYGALGSLVSRMEELSSTIMPVTMVFIIAFMVVMFSMGSGSVDNLLMKICSFIPLTSPMAMFVRIAMGEVANWEIAVSVAILVVSTAGIGFLAAGIYRMGVLLYGKPPKPAEIIKMLKNNK